MDSDSDMEDEPHVKLVRIYKSRQVTASVLPALLYFGYFGLFRAFWSFLKDCSGQHLRKLDTILSSKLVFKLTGIYNLPLFNLDPHA